MWKFTSLLKEKCNQRQTDRHILFTYTRHKIQWQTVRAKKSCVFTSCLFTWAALDCIHWSRYIPPVTSTAFTTKLLIESGFASRHLRLHQGSHCESANILLFIAFCHFLCVCIQCYISNSSSCNYRFMIEYKLRSTFCLRKYLPIWSTKRKLYGNSSYTFCFNK